MRLQLRHTVLIEVTVTAQIAIKVTVPVLIEVTVKAQIAIKVTVPVLYSGAELGPRLQLRLQLIFDGLKVHPLEMKTE